VEAPYTSVRVDAPRDSVLGNPPTVVVKAPWGGWGYYHWPVKYHWGPKYYGGYKYKNHWGPGVVVVPGYRYEYGDPRSEPQEPQGGGQGSADGAHGAGGGSGPGYRYSYGY